MKTISGEIMSGNCTVGNMKQSDPQGLKFGFGSETERAGTPGS